jgi:DNA-3-methyladenine glycosylase
VYFTYGNHWMMNAVTGRAGEGTAVLLRAAEPLQGLEVMAAHRGRDNPRDLCSGPGKLAKAFGVAGAQNGQDLVRASDVNILEGQAVARSRVSRTTRVGVTLGAERRWRFIVTGNPFVSRGRPSGG